ncbi:cyanophycinase [Haliscomenobacter hydrossis]|uniref:Cyanophycinase-like protein n=1 Tax=Haliscomenobacter hydrossis (strain ATCC 27775 / DSM 1100 / LMG 10767 / O) TaxID=760192 RepID=F4KVN3_HALH1|nr:cyanophycinase [Haliscomenobacter hydrossis]AEE52490.1 cyanophycinase-like protein [Haliscomenobacter hydrossis DSM 1100]
MKFSFTLSIGLLGWIVFFLPSTLQAKVYTSYFTGDTSDVKTPTTGVTVLMGGAKEDRNAMIWFLQHSGGGDVLVLRASGSDGYNKYLYTELGQKVNSVESILCHNDSSGYDPYIIRQVLNAEALWFAGGNQANYVRYWNNTPLDSAIQYVINVKRIPVGGTSAGMAILGSIVYSAENGGIQSPKALTNPYDSAVTLLKDDFIRQRWLKGVITDTHYDARERQGRHVVFIARIIQDYGEPAYGIAAEEYTAVCIEANGLARVYGDPSRGDFAYFIRPAKRRPKPPGRCTPGQSLHWEENRSALKVYKVPGTPDGSHSFQLTNWKKGSGGSWQDWFVVNGVLEMKDGAVAPKK